MKALLGAALLMAAGAASAALEDDLWGNQKTFEVATESRPAPNRIHRARSRPAATPARPRSRAGRSSSPALPR